MNTTTSKRSKALRLCGFSLILILVCVLVSYFTAQWVMHERDWQHDKPHGHAWLSEELGLNDEESARIDAFEVDYRAEKAALHEDFNQRIDYLAQLLRTQDRYSEEVTHAIHQLHEVHGELQTLSIEHYYDMLSVLPPDKQAKLREIAVEALSQPE